MTVKSSIKNKTTAARTLRGAVVLILGILILSSLLSVFTGCNSDTGTNPSDTTAEVVFTAVDLSGYKIIRPTDASTTEASLSSELKAAIMDATGLNLKISDDYAKSADDIDAGAAEILIGNTNRPESQTAAEGLKSVESGYSVTFNGKKICICGSDIVTLEAGIKYFTENFIKKADGSVIKLEENLTLIKPVEGQTLKIAENGDPKYTIIRTDNDDIYLSAIASSLHDKIEKLTGGDQKVKTDLIAHGKEYDSNTFEILIGTTKYPQTAEAEAKLGAAEYGIFAIDNKIVVTGKNRTTVKLAAEKFEKLLEASAKKNDGGRVDIELLYIEPLIYTDAEFYNDIPKMTAGTFVGSYDCGNGALEALYKDTTQADFTAYKAELVAAGYTLYAENNTSAIQSATYTSGNSTAHAYFVKNTGEIRIITEPKGELFPTIAESYNPTTTPSVTQLALSYTTDNTNGMGYVITLPDGSYIIYDGGFTADAKNLYDYLVANNKTADKPKIAAWVITHMHGDHVQCLKEFATSYGKSVTLGMIITNVPALSASDTEDTVPSYYSDGRFKTSAASFAGVKVIKPHTGQIFAFPGAKLEILYTHEDLYPTVISVHNDASVVTRLTMEGQKIIFLGDAQTDASNVMCKMYGSGLKSDIVQIAHHGSQNGATEALYSLIAAKVAFFPGASERYDVNKSFPVNAYIINNSTVKKVIVADPQNTTLTLPTALD